MTRSSALARYQRETALWSRDVVGLALYPYQTPWADRIVSAAADDEMSLYVPPAPRRVNVGSIREVAERNPSPPGGSL